MRYLVECERNADKPVARGCSVAKPNTLLIGGDECPLFAEKGLVPARDRRALWFV